jgi:hypothetical protein
MEYIIVFSALVSPPVWTILVRWKDRKGEIANASGYREKKIE